MRRGVPLLTTALVLLAVCVAAACSSDRTARSSDAPDPAPTTATDDPAATAPTEPPPGLPPRPCPPSGSHATDDPTVVVTDRGPVQGILEGDRGVVRFLGIPFAVPPVGEQRWRLPQAPPAWDGVRPATTPAPACAQAGSSTSPMEGVEDCLYLDVYAPAERRPAGSPARPVLVWLHGGGFTLGAPGFTDGRALAEHFGAIVVAPAYRLGPFGFAASAELAGEDPSGSTGDYGFADQVRALEWVQDNADAFGGDRGNVTLFGESAGAWSVCLHVVSPASAGLFHRAVIESGPCAYPLVSPEAASAQTGQLAAAVGCPPYAGQSACLRTRTPAELLAALPDDGPFGLNGGARWGPMVDGHLVPLPVREAVAAGQLNRVPTIVGWNTDEGRLFGGTDLVLRDELVGADPYRQALSAFGGTDASAVDELLARYPLAAYGDADEAFAAAMGDAVLKCPGRRLALDLAAQGVPVWVYSFAYPRATFSLPVPSGRPGAFHSAEVQFVFATPLKPDDPVEQSLGREMAARWVQLAATGDPNGSYLAPAPAWARFHDASSPHLVFDEQVGTGAGLDREVCDFWDAVDYRWADGR